MQRLVLALILSLSCIGCGAAVAAALLSGGDIDDLVENFEESVQTQQQLAEFAMKAARGEIDISQYDYDPPTQANGMTGTLTLNDGQLPFGSGDVQIVLQVDGDGVPVDPYGQDLSSLSQIDGIVDIRFRGKAPSGKSLAIDADVDISTIANSATDVTAIMAGNWDVNLDGYGTNMSTGGMEFDIDLATEQVTRAVGSIDGDIDIPNFPIDADFDIEGLGDKLQAAIDVGVTDIDIDIDLDSLF
ncbi:MAG: hypothetical protein ACYTHK_04090 [Planctomycetota bacterium]|jgi:hypothetical protein